MRRLQCIQSNLEDAGLTCSPLEMSYVLADSPLANKFDPALVMETTQCRGKLGRGSPVCSQWQQTFVLDSLKLFVSVPHF